MAYTPIPLALIGRYLESTEVIDWKTQSVRAKAHELVVGLETDVEKAKALFEWVRDEVAHIVDIGSDVVTCKASEVLREGVGICFAKSHLLAALLRVNGIPAGFCYQIIKDRPAPLTGRALHGLNAVRLSSLDYWLRVDSRGNKVGVNAQFNPEREQIAYPELAFFDQHVYPEPFPSVIHALTAASNRNELLQMLPDGPKKEHSS